MPGNCAKFGNVQDVLTSADQGATWRMVTNPAAHANTCTAAYLISLRSGQVALLEGGFRSEFGPLLSNDSGATWTVVSVPALPPAPGSGSEPLTPSTLLLPDGSLLGFGAGASDQLLPPGARAWCVETGVALAAQIEDGQRYEVVGSKLWWIDVSGTQPLPRSVALGTLSC